MSRPARQTADRWTRPAVRRGDGLEADLLRDRRPPRRGGSRPFGGAAWRCCSGQRASSSPRPSAAGASSSASRSSSFRARIRPVSVTRTGTVACPRSELLHVLRRDLFAAFRDDFAGRLVDDRLGEDPAARRCLARGAAGRELERLPRIEERPYVLVLRVAERAQERRHPELVAPVGANEHLVLDAHPDLDPRAAVRDDLREVQRCAVRVHPLLEEHAGRTVELAHDHALRAVHDERASVGDEGDLTQVDLGLLGLDELPLPAFPRLPPHEPKRGLQRRLERQIALAALLDGVLRLPQTEALVLEGVRPLMPVDRKEAPEDLIQAGRLA